MHDINGYLNENKNTSADYQIIKEIVERDSQKIEEDVDTMLSPPLYLGLMATILGAAIGVVSFAWTDLGTLLTGTNIQVEGIKTDCKLSWCHVYSYFYLKVQGGTR